MLPADTGLHPDKGAELNASFPLDAECGLRGEGADRLVEHLLGMISAGEARIRRPTARAAKLRRLTVEALLANLIVAAFHRFNPRRYVAVPFQRRAFAGLGLSCDAMVLARDAMISANLIDHQPGFHDPQFLGFIEAGRRTRIRANFALRNLFEQFGVSGRNVQRKRSKSLIKLKPASLNLSPEPPGVKASRDILIRINSRFDAHDIDLPEEAWERLRQKAAQYQPEHANDEHSIPYVGDPTAKALYRVFTRDWSRGGRLYGAWWLNVPGNERRQLTIDDIATVEIDFGNIHPALLYYAKGIPLTIDPYALPPYSRDLCKETFQRLINGSIQKGGADLRRPKDFNPPDGVAFLKFVRDYKHHLYEIADFFGKDVGLMLQRADSELALAILDSMDVKGIITLPVHDSFIVQEPHEGTLYSTMQEVYQERFHIEPKLKVTRPEPRAAHRGHYWNP